MAEQAGHLLINRQRITLAAGDNDIDTGLKQTALNFDPDPNMADRTMVLPMAPLDNWAGVTHENPYYDAGTGTVHVVINNPGGEPVVINVLFWDPHTSIGPIDVDDYNVVEQPPI